MPVPWILWDRPAVNLSAMFFGVANGVSTEMPVMVFEWTDLTDFRVTHLATPPPPPKKRYNED